MERRQFLAVALSCGAVLSAVPARADGGTVSMTSLYNPDLTFSDLALELAGQSVSVKGFMAPPLRADSHFFVLTRFPMAVCPFCMTGAEWPEDILAVFTKRPVSLEPFNVWLLARGVLVLGDYQDPDTGFVSRLRMTNAVYERV